MKTNLLQSQLHRNAALITMLCKQLSEAKADAKGAQLAASRRHHRATVAKLRVNVIKLAAIQKGIKFDLLAMKLARLRNDGVFVRGGAVTRKKHGKADQRYIQWRLTHMVDGEGIGLAAQARAAA